MNFPFIIDMPMFDSILFTFILLNFEIMRNKHHSSINVECMYNECLFMLFFIKSDGRFYLVELIVFRLGFLTLFSTNFFNIFIH
ncbi:hypothetical protein PG1821B_1615 [Bifidobacterium animalis subsp. lactis]|nr:hypothetical protein PG1821B_1615 [Bifidobacterium animalis subsp. lactis]